MSVWTTVVIASILSFALKFSGYLVPERLLAGERTTRVTGLLPVALLSALVAVQVFTTTTGALALDARAGGLAVAVVALLCRAPFIVVVVLAAATAALLRALT